MASVSRPNAVIRFEPDGYDVRRPWLMGRQVAGNGFLRAAVAARQQRRLDCLTARPASAEAFAAMVREIDPSAESGWLRPDQMGDIGDGEGVLYLADATVSSWAKTREPFGRRALSLCGVTHTTASLGALNEIAGLLTAPVASWDALICTSSAVAETVRRVHEAEREAIERQTGRMVGPPQLQLPVIPLGVHCSDFELAPGDREAARAALGVSSDEIVVTFVGRLAFTGKHHPFAMYHALQAVAQDAGVRIVLVQCGWAPNDTIAEAFRTGPAYFAQDVRTLHLDGREPPLLRRAWAAGDIFMSFSDGIQETFGLTPIEAMAAGLPCVVSDWNGYKDTVEDGVQGFRIPTFAPGPGPVGEAMARRHKAGDLSYDLYLWHAAAATVVALEPATDRLAALVSNPDLRKRMGEAGRRRARETYDWSVVMGQYQALWADLNARRAAATDDGAVATHGQGEAMAGPFDPFYAFGHYPTALIDRATRVSLSPGADREAHLRRRSHILFRYVTIPEAIANGFLHLAGRGDTTVEALSAGLRISVDLAAHYVGQLAKMGLVRLGSPQV